jgi:hypothetical protein
MITLVSYTAILDYVQTRSTFHNTSQTGTFHILMIFHQQQVIHCSAVSVKENSILPRHVTSISGLWIDSFKNITVTVFLSSFLFFSQTLFCMCYRHNCMTFTRDMLVTVYCPLSQLLSK